MFVSQAVSHIFFVFKLQSDDISFWSRTALAPRSTRLALLNESKIQVDQK